METKIQKWGNSLGVRLPGALAKRQALRAGSRVTFEEVEDGVIIKTVKDTPKTLSDLVADITPHNLHAAAEWGDTPRGKEIW